MAAGSAAGAPMGGERARSLRASIVPQSRKARRSYNCAFIYKFTNIYWTFYQRLGILGPSRDEEAVLSSELAS
jgi:hypothetical protein